MTENLNILNKLNTKIFITENHFMQPPKFIDPAEYFNGLCLF